jgi:hypothetical protein
MIGPACVTLKLGFSCNPLISNGVVTATLHAVLLVPAGDGGSEAAGTLADVQALVIPDDVQAQMRRSASQRHFVRTGPEAARTQ